MLAEDTSTGKIFAVKLVNKRSLLLQGDDSVMVERRVLQLASGSPFLVHAEFGFQTKLHVFHGLEYVSGGDFRNHLQQNGPLNIPSARFYAAELVCGIQFLHGEGIIHRDLKPGNILMTATGHLKITDFGLAAFNIHGDRTTTGCVGTEGYMAPEILDGEKYDAGVDWYSFGIILRRMVTSEGKYHQTLDTRSGLDNIVKQVSSFRSHRYCGCDHILLSLLLHSLVLRFSFSASSGGSHQTSRSPWKHQGLQVLQACELGHRGSLRAYPTVHTSSKVSSGSSSVPSAHPGGIGGQRRHRRAGPGLVPGILLLPRL
ncbi:calcium-independent protein kinase C activity, partial [Pristimantis euphronides]